MGSTSCFRANAAYSLYGVLKGQADTGCDKSTFINSFFTTAGVEAFSQSMYAAGVNFHGGNDDDNDNDNDYPGGVSSACSASDNDNDDDKDENDDDDAVEHNQRSDSGSKSYGLGCQSNHFVKMSFDGAYCDKNKQIKVTNSLGQFNRDLSRVACIPVYESSGGDDDDNEGNEGGGGEGENDALDVLSYSRACRVREFPQTCPDPHGKLRSYARADERAVAMATNPRRERIKTAFSWTLLALGTVLLLLAFLVHRRRSRLSRQKQKQRESERRKSKGFWGSGSNKPSSNKSSSQSMLGGGGGDRSQKKGLFKKVFGRRW